MAADSPQQYAFEQILQMQFDNAGQKKQKLYGLKLAQSMWAYIGQANNSYYETRRTQWETTRMWSKGTKDNEEFKSWMGVEGNRSEEAHV